MASQVSVEGLRGGLPDAHERVDVARPNDGMLRMARLEGELPWPSHEAVLFLCWERSFRFELDRTTLSLKATHPCAQTHSGIVSLARFAVKEKAVQSNV